MLQPTPQLLRRPPVSVATGIRLLAHPKVPLTVAESASLLNALTTSFRRQLDQEHGEDVTKTAKVAESASGAKQVKDVKRRESTHTERHFHGILANPLFKPYRSVDVHNSRDPMDVFDRACAAGLMKPDRARACLIMKKASLKASATDQWSAVTAGPAGAKVFKWLLSSCGAMENLSWLFPVPVQGIAHDMRFRPDIIFECLVLGGKEQVLWDLFEHHVGQKTKGVDQLLYHMSKTIARVKSLAAGYQSMIRAKAILQERGFSDGVCRRVLKDAVYGLFQQTTSSSGAAGVPDALFEDFMQKAKACLRHASTLPRLHLYHPTKVNTGPALDYLQGLTEPTPEEIKHFIGWLALDTARHLLRQKQLPEAKWVMDFLQETWVNDPEWHDGHVVKQKYRLTAQQIRLREREDGNLALLDGLDVLPQTG